MSEKRKSVEQAGGASKKASTETSGRGKRGAAAIPAVIEKAGQPEGKGGEFVTSLEFKESLLNRSVESLAYVKKNGVVFFVDRTDKVSEVFKVRFFLDSISKGGEEWRERWRGKKKKRKQEKNADATIFFLFLFIFL